MNYKKDKPLKINPEEPEGVSNRFYFDLRSYQNLVHDYLNGEIKKVIHARWVLSGMRPYMICSNCKHWFSSSDLVNFCPNCGAKMDLDEIDEKELNKTPIDRVNDAIDNIEMLEDLLEDK